MGSALTLVLSYAFWTLGIVIYFSKTFIKKEYITNLLAVCYILLQLSLIFGTLHLVLLPPEQNSLWNIWVVISSSIFAGRISFEHGKKDINQKQTN